MSWQSGGQGGRTCKVLRLSNKEAFYRAAEAAQLLRNIIHAAAEGGAGTPTGKRLANPLK
jgi:hypothetical protein